MKIPVRNLSRETTGAKRLALFGGLAAAHYCRLVSHR